MQNQQSTSALGERWWSGPRLSGEKQNASLHIETPINRQAMPAE